MTISGTCCECTAPADGPHFLNVAWCRTCWALALHNTKSPTPARHTEMGQKADKEPPMRNATAMTARGIALASAAGIIFTIGGTGAAHAATTTPTQRGCVWVTPTECVPVTTQPCVPITPTDCVPTPPANCAWATPTECLPAASRHHHWSWWRMMMRGSLT